MSYARFDELGCEPEKEQVEKFSPAPGRCGPDFGDTKCEEGRCCSEYGWCGGKKGTKSAWCSSGNGKKGHWNGDYDGKSTYTKTTDIQSKGDITLGDFVVGEQAFTETGLKQRYRQTFKHCSSECKGHCISKSEFPFVDCGTWKAQVSCRKKCFSDRNLDYGKRDKYM